MKFTEISLKRPILVLMVTLIIILLGIISYERTPIDLMPDVTLPTLTVTTDYTNVGAEEIENAITRPIEEIIATIADVEDITSESSEGRSRVRINFKWGKDLEAAAADVREKIDRIRNRLPDDADPPVLYKYDLSGFPVMFLGVESRMDINKLQEFVEDKIKYRLDRLPGVASTDIRGGRAQEVQIFIDREKADALNIPLNKIVSSLRDNNLNQAAGYINEGMFEIVIRSLGEFKDIDDIKGRVMAVKNGVPVLVRDIAEVKMTIEKATDITHINEHPGVLMLIYKQSGANTVEVASEVNAELIKINNDYPYLKIFAINDTSQYIKNSINSVKTAAIYGTFLAILILFFFLRDLRSTFIIGVSIPVSIIATFILLYSAGFTLNIISFGGLALGIGMLVDNAIIVLENSYRHIVDEKLDKIQGALIGTKEVTGAIVASTLTTVVVFLPMIFISGVSGIMFKQMAYMITFSLLCSLIVSLTIVPLLTSRYLHIVSSKNNNRSHSLLHWIYVYSENFFKRIDSQYTVLLKYVLQKKKLAIIISLFMFIVSIVLIKGLGFEFMPSADEGELRINIEAAVGTRLELMEKYLKLVEQKIDELVPEKESTISRVGGGWGSRSGHTGSMRVKLVDLKRRKRSSEEVASVLTRKLAEIPGIKCRVRTSTGLWIMRRLSSSIDKISIEVRGENLDTGRIIAEKLASEVEKIEGISDVKVSREEGRPEKNIRIDYKKAARLGLSVTDINDMVYIGLGGKVATYLRSGGREYDILVQYKNAEDMSTDDLLNLPLNLPAGKKTILGAVVDILPSTGPVTIERLNQERVIFVDADFTGRALGDIIKEIQGVIRHMVIPREFTVNLGGEYEEQQKSFREMLFVLFLAITLVYMVMAAQFESLLDPFIVLFSVPLALIGVIITLLITNTTFNVQAFIGLIMLTGIVVNNAILMVDYTNILRREQGYRLYEGIITASRRKLRPILMTTLTTVLALLPLAIGIGEGSEMQVPLARTVCGGLISSTFITLLLIPVLYAVFEHRLKNKSTTTDQKLKSSPQGQIPA